MYQNEVKPKYPVKNIKTTSHYCILLIFILLIQPLKVTAGIQGNLVNAKWLEKNLYDPNILIFDVSPSKIYSEKHIQGAVSVDLFKWYGIKEISITDMEKLFQSWGISSGKKIVIYDQGGSMWATRLFFSLYYYGYPEQNLLILDGGMAKWEEQGLPVTKDIKPYLVKGTYEIKKINEEVRVRLPEFLTASGDPVNNKLVEALGAEWHFGEVLAFNKAGHIPNALLLPSTDFYNEDKTFKPAEEIKQMMEYLDIKPEQTIYTHCGGGIAASVPFFVLKFILNYPKVALYSESQLGWLADERDLPYWTYDAPYLLRETGWLQFWGGKILRMYGGSNVSIIDLRNEDAFYQGHVPFAVNISSEVFKNNFNDPGKLIEILGSEGVRSSDEVVIISGEGITKESALSFVLLEKLGQKKISVFMDSMNKWTQLGFKLIVDTTVSEPKSKSDELSIPTATYQENLREEIIIKDLESTQGLYPKVLIASGKNKPAQSLEGKLVHIPFTELINADGTPKAAKDIWNILNKAGVPRYAELICFSDDPGEAAVNYLILKLMGYPDIKILLI